MAQTKTQKILRYVIYSLLGLVVAGTLSYVLVIRPLQVRNQKANFDKAEASLDTLAKQIETLIGKPDEIKKEKSCDRANLLSEKGPLVCTVSEYILYRNRNSEESTQFMEKLSGLSKQAIRTGSVSATNQRFVSALTIKGEQTFYQDFDLISGLNCSFSYSYPATQREFITSGENFEAGIICSADSMSEFYPLND